nr:MAG TPA: hypothetical protein [Caudoviricetes sp.]
MLRNIPNYQNMIFRRYYSKLKVRKNGYLQAKKLFD